MHKNFSRHDLAILMSKNQNLGLSYDMAMFKLNQVAIWRSHKFKTLSGHQYKIYVNQKRQYCFVQKKSPKVIKTFVKKEKKPR